MVQEQDFCCGPTWGIFSLNDRISAIASLILIWYVNTTVAGKMLCPCFWVYNDCTVFPFHGCIMVACTISLDYGFYISLFYIDFKNQTQTYWKLFCQLLPPNIMCIKNTLNEVWIRRFFTSLMWRVFLIITGSENHTCLLCFGIDHCHSYQHFRLKACYIFILPLVHLHDDT